MENKIKKILSIVLIGIMFGAIPGVASLTLSPGPGSWDWTGHGDGAIRICNSGETPYLHWIFTQDHHDISLVNLTLKVSGIAFAPVVMTEHSGGSWTVDTGYYDPSTLGGTHVNFTVATGDTGNGDINLNISDGCTGSQIPEFPTVALPIAAVIGLVFFFQNRKKKEE